ncbi:MAG: UbiA family prenyltransferase, partial [Bacteroidota bacterium]
MARKGLPPAALPGCMSFAMYAHVSPARIVTIAFWRSYVVTMRPYLLFVSGITGIAGLSLAPEVPLLNTMLLSLTFLLSYGFGQALTDSFQMDTDSLSAPYRPLVQGKLRRSDVLVVSLLGLILSGVVVVLHNFLNLFLALLTIVGLSTYTYFKRRWWAGPIYNAWIVTVLCLIGYLS